ncbi:hypothetical protein [Desulfolithobacter sp.]
MTEEQTLRTSVTPNGTFRVGVHRPSYSVVNLREQDFIAELGTMPDGSSLDNAVNFPDGDVHEGAARWIYEIPNALFFRGATYIDSGWAAARAVNPSSIRIKKPSSCSLLAVLGRHLKPDQARRILGELPRPVLYDLAANSTDPEELVMLAGFCCRMTFDKNGQPAGLVYRKKDGTVRADIDDFELFETIANNPCLPDRYKEIMVLRPGVQGSSEIVGEFRQGSTHVFEYLRRNSYIPWGHFAANMAHDAIRYRTSELSLQDMQGLRHLYYQRTFCVLADRLGLNLPRRRKSLSVDELETLRQKILRMARLLPEHPATLWGWNFGYDFSGSGYRLHASHQMIHQQYAMVPEEVEQSGGGTMAAYSAGDLVADAAGYYRAEHGSDFFTDYLRCLFANGRTDGGQGPDNLIVWQDENVLLFVPKAQVSQWELQLMVVADTDEGPVGNVIEARTAVRQSIDSAILVAQRIYAGLGARMVTSIEYAKRLGRQNGQRLLYSFLPKLPWSMGAFSEAQLRFICGHFPEDFAVACRLQLDRFVDDIEQE